MQNGSPSCKTVLCHAELVSASKKHWHNMNMSVELWILSDFHYPKADVWELVIPF